ncbi:MAG: FKBP-type peptidyl-prolyl cis-trans isomerase [Bacteroidota bacterium]
MRKLIRVFVMILLITSCGTYSEDQKSDFDRKIESHIKKNKLDLKKSNSGLYFKITKEGEGRFVKFGDKVSFTYKGTFLDGKVFDHREVPVEFDVKALISAWREIMLELKKGGEAYLISPPQLAYGDHQLDDIPENSILVYEIKLIDVK